MHVFIMDAEPGTTRVECWRSALLQVHGGFIEALLGAWSKMLGPADQQMLVLPPLYLVPAANTFTTAPRLSLLVQGEVVGRSATVVGRSARSTQPVRAIQPSLAAERQQQLARMA